MKYSVKICLLRYYIRTISNWFKIRLKVSKHFLLFSGKYELSINHYFNQQLHKGLSSQFGCILLFFNVNYLSFVSHQNCINFGSVVVYMNSVTLLKRYYIYRKLWKVPQVFINLSSNSFILGVPTLFAMSVSVPLVSCAQLCN